MVGVANVFRILIRLPLLSMLTISKTDGAGHVFPCGYGRSGEIVSFRCAGKSLEIRNANIAATPVIIRGCRLP